MYSSGHLLEEMFCYKWQNISFNIYILSRTCLFLHPVGITCYFSNVVVYKLSNQLAYINEKYCGCDFIVQFLFIYFFNAIKHYAVV